MRIFTASLLAAAGFVLAIGLLVSVSERSTPHVPPAPEAPAAAIPNVPDRHDPVIVCIVPPPAAADEGTEASNLPCPPSADHSLSMETQITRC